MPPNPIDEIKQIRHQLGAEAGFDVHSIFEQLREQHAVSDRTYLLRNAYTQKDDSFNGEVGGEQTMNSESTTANE